MTQFSTESIPPLAHAGLGEVESVIAGRRRFESASEGDYLWTADRLMFAAIPYALVDEHERAIDGLEELGGLRYRGWLPSKGGFELPTWDPLRDDPRFQALMANWERRE